MKLYQLDKTVLRFKNKPVEFLSAYSTNTLDRPRSAFVDIHGKIVAVFDQKPLEGGEVFVVIEKSFLERLRRHLGKYLELSGTHMEEEKLFTYFDLNGDYIPGAGEWVIPQRIGKLVVTPQRLDSNVSPEEFTLFRVQSRLPLQGLDYDDTLLLNIGDEEFVSYTKGCYLGQEIIARVHFRGKPPRQLAVRNQDECAPEQVRRLTSVVNDPLTGKKMGFLIE